MDVFLGKDVLKRAELRGQELVRDGVDELFVPMTEGSESGPRLLLSKERDKVTPLHTLEVSGTVLYLGFPK